MTTATPCPSGTGSDTDISGWIRLQATPGVGPGTARRLLSAFGLPANIFCADRARLRTVVSDRIAAALAADLPADIARQIDRTLEWLSQPGNRLLTLADAGYPQSLLTITDPPVMLCVKGRTELLQRDSLAVVGSRNATAQGVANAGQFSEALSAAGLTIVSGLALGIDAAAHAGALQHAGGSTIAVIGTGCDIVYPARNRELAHRIAAEGCIVSEYPVGTPAIAANFPRRNRIISGLSRAVLVVEAAAASGSLITARMAAEQGRDVLAIPGSIHAPLAKGCHQLIKQGAKLVESAQDVLDEIAFRPAAGPAPHLASFRSSQPERNDGETPDALLEALGFDPVAVDVLACRADLPVDQLQSRLLLLELDGMVEMLPGNIVRRVH